MFIETTYMRLGNGPAGTTGIATDCHQMVKWALSFALTAEVAQHILAMNNNEQHTLHTHHKEETEGRIRVDKADHLSIRNTLDICIDPLDDKLHPNGALMNIISGQIAQPGVNADEAVSLGQQAYQHSMFNPDGEMKITKSKSTLKRKLQVAISEHNCPFPDTVIYYVSALLWILN